MGTAPHLTREEIAARMKNFDAALGDVPAQNDGSRQAFALEQEGEKTLLHTAKFNDRGDLTYMASLEVPAGMEEKMSEYCQNSGFTQMDDLAGVNAVYREKHERDKSSDDYAPKIDPEPDPER